MPKKFFSDSIPALKNNPLVSVRECFFWTGTFFIKNVPASTISHEKLSLFDLLWVYVSNTLPAAYVRGGDDGILFSPSWTSRHEKFLSEFFFLGEEDGGFNVFRLFGDGEMVRGYSDSMYDDLPDDSIFSSISRIEFRKYAVVTARRFLRRSRGKWPSHLQKAHDTYLAEKRKAELTRLLQAMVPYEERTTSMCNSFHSFHFDDFW